MDVAFKVLHRIDPSLARGNISRKTLVESAPMQEFLDHFASISLYSMELAKCDLQKCPTKDCAICTKYFGAKYHVMSDEDLKKVHPFPHVMLLRDDSGRSVVKDGKLQYKRFHEVYGKIETTEQDRPSMVLDGKKGLDKSHKHNFIPERVIDTVRCAVCHKRRALFIPKILTAAQRIAWQVGN